MTTELLVGIASIVALGIAAEWLAWRIQLPSILVLLIVGLIAGPVTGWLEPDVLLGDLLFPIVSLSVAIILFEGGLSLRVRELRAIGGVVRNLVTVGVLLTWVLSAVAAWLILDMRLSFAVLLGAILVVTGPTVIVPLLRHIRPTGQVGSTLKWEAMLNDPIGAALAVLVFEVILAGGLAQATEVAVLGLVRTAVIAVLLAALGAGLLIQVLKRDWVPDYLQSPVTLMVVITGATVSNLLQTESGLLTATLMGVALANQRGVVVRHIIEFKENLRVLLISSLFILLSARIPPEQLSQIDVGHLAFLAVLMLVIRPVTVGVSTIGSALNWRERSFLAGVAPRGIVAAAVASLFALELASAGYAGAEALVPVTFAVIVGTVAIYGLGATPMARWFRVAKPNPQGLLIVGAHGWGRELAEVLRQEGYTVRLVDTNYMNVVAARMAGFPTYYGSAVTESALDEIELNGIGRLLAITSNDEVNSLTALHFADIFGRAEVYQLPPERAEAASREAVPIHLRGRLLFDEGATYRRLSARFRAGGEVMSFDLTEEFGEEELRARHSEALPLFVIGESGEITVCTADSPAALRPGERVVALVGPRESTSTAEAPARGEPAAPEPD